LRIILLCKYFFILVPKYPYEANKFEKIGLIAGGTGITPMVRPHMFYFKANHLLI